MAVVTQRSVSQLSAPGIRNCPGPQESDRSGSASAAKRRPKIARQPPPLSTKRRERSIATSSGHACAPFRPPARASRSAMGRSTASGAKAAEPTGRSAKRAPTSPPSPLPSSAAAAQPCQLSSCEVLVPAPQRRARRPGLAPRDEATASCKGTQKGRGGAGMYT